MNKYLKIGFVFIFYLIYILLSSLDKQFSIPEKWSLFYMAFMQIVFLTALILLYLNDFKKYINDFKKNWRKHLKLGFSLWIIGVGLMILLNMLIIKLFATQLPGNEQAVRSLIADSPLLFSFLIIFITPMIEEITFRKVFYDAFNNKTIFIIISGFSFGLLHVLGQASNIYEWLYAIPYIILGIAFALSYTKTKNLLTPICLHMMHNFIAVIQILMLMWGGL